MDAGTLYSFPDNCTARESGALMAYPGPPLDPQLETVIGMLDDRYRRGHHHR
jgi:hypothetical protein